MPGAIQLTNLVDIALEVWRVEQCCKRLQVAANREDSALTFSMEKIRHSLREMGLEIKDPAGERYQEGLSLDVLAFDYPEGESHEHGVIQETMSPAIYYNGQLVRLAQVIVGKMGGQNPDGESNS
jgi:hypothetical protein